MKNIRVTYFFAVSAVASLILSGGASPALAGDAGAKSDLPGLIAWDGPVPDLESAPTTEAPGRQMPEFVSDGIWELEISGYGSKVNTFEWDSENSELVVYSTEGLGYWGPIFEEYLGGQTVRLVDAVNSKEQIDEVMRSIVQSGGLIEGGSSIVTAIPAKDGSFITLGVEPALTGRSSIPLDEKTAASSLDTSVPLRLEPAPPVTAATRNASGSSPSWLGGNAMRTDAATGTSYYICSTGFSIGRFSNGEKGMLSAEHCGRNKPRTNWQYSTGAQSLANLLGTFQGFLSSSGVNSDTALWAGGNLAGGKMLPAIYTGNHLNTSTGEYIRGGNYPAVGTDVCYSGSRSGRVCENEVLYTGITACYNPAQCYAGLTWTSQRANIEAVGNGDSGGPVYQMVSGKAMASGVVSGIVGGSQTCTGDAGSSTRSCSPVALYAPIVAALGSGGDWGLSYLP